MAYDNHLIDKRVVDRNIAKGLVDPAEYKRIVEALPDREANSVHVSLDGSSGSESSSTVDLSDDLGDDEDDDLDDEEDEEDEDDAP